MLLGGGSERERDRWWLFEWIEVGDARMSGCSACRCRGWSMLRVLLGRRACDIRYRSCLVGCDGVVGSLSLSINFFIWASGASATVDGEQSFAGES